MPITNRDRSRLAGPGVPLVADDILVATDDEAVTRLRHAIERTAEHVRDTVLGVAGPSASCL